MSPSPPQFPIQLSMPNDHTNGMTGASANVVANAQAAGTGAQSIPATKLEDYPLPGIAHLIQADIVRSEN
jgi:hypothetical protein